MAIPTSRQTAFDCLNCATVRDVDPSKQPKRAKQNETVFLNAEIRILSSRSPFAKDCGGTLLTTLLDNNNYEYFARLLLVSVFETCSMQSLKFWSIILLICLMISSNCLRFQRFSLIKRSLSNVPALKTGTEVW
jgi:hypothetical protein